MNLKYLKNQSEPEAHLAAKILAGDRYEHYLAIPCCGEDELLPRTLASIHKLEKPGRLLLFLLINEGQDTSKHHILSNHTTIKNLIDSYDFETRASEPPSYFATTPDFDILLITRTARHCFPPRQGVGLARKIAADIGLSLFAKRYYAGRGSTTAMPTPLSPKTI